MARRRRSTVASGRGSWTPLGRPPRPAPEDFFPHDLLEDADRLRHRQNDLFLPQPLRTVYQGGPRYSYRSPLYPLARPAESRLSVFARNAPRLNAGLRVDRRVVLCVKRKFRRESLFALRKIGFKGSSPGRRSKFTDKLYRRSGDSRYSCV